MYTIEFYEDRNGKCDLSDFLHMLHAAHREEFCKAAAFLDTCDFVRRIGDCDRPGKIGPAIRYGYYAAMDI